MKFVSVITFVLLASNLAKSEEIVDRMIASADRAMESGLWDVATNRLQRIISRPDLSNEYQVKISLLLAESLIRDNQASAALEILDKPLLNKIPQVAFWRGQALAGQGQFSDAVETLSIIAADSSNPFQKEAAMTAASLELSLSNTDKALEILRFLESSKNPANRAESVFHRIEILIDEERYEEAKILYPEPNEIPDSLIATAKFLAAKLALKEGKAAEAETLFSTLLTSPQGQSITRYNQAAIGKADALAAQGKKDLATQSLLTFIQAQPDTPLLEPMFRKIIDWLPDEIITADLPALALLAGWIQSPPPPSSGLINTFADTAAAAWPVASTEISDLAVFSMHGRAIGLHRINNPAAKEEARRLMQRILLLAPRHFLAPRALLALAKWCLENNEPEQAFALFDSLRQTAKSTLVKGEATFFDAKIAYDKGEYELAESLYQEAATLLSGENQNNARLNAALTRLNENDDDTILIQAENPAISKRLNNEFKLEKALANPDAAKTKLELDHFLTENPKHPRAAEIRIKIIEAALASTPSDLSLAKAQLDTIKAKDYSMTSEQSARLSLAELRLLDALGKNTETVELAKKIIERFPKTNTESQASLIMGKCLFRSGSYNESRFIFEKLANSQSGTQLAQAAFLLAARSAALGATDQSRQEALSLFDQTITIDGPLRALAILEKARLNIELNQLNTAIDSLTSAYQSTSPEDLSRLPTGLLLAEAIYARGDSDPEKLINALKIYNELITLSANNPAQYFRLQYLRGLTLEKLPDPKNPDQTRLGDALSAYFSVLDRPLDPAPPEWEWFERSGFRALTLLENAERWQAAISIAEKIASFGGPRAEEAATRARQLRLKHMIWED